MDSNIEARLKDEIKDSFLVYPGYMDDMEALASHVAHYLGENLPAGCWADAQSSRGPAADGPWGAGENVTARLAAGEIAPDGTILRDRDGDIYKACADGAFTDWMPGLKRWRPTLGWSWDDSALGRLRRYAPLHVATPEQLREAGIEASS